VPPPGKLDETYSSSLILAHCLHYADVVHKTEYTQFIALSSEKDRATATVNIYRKYDEM